MLEFDKMVVCSIAVKIGRGRVVSVRVLGLKNPPFATFLVAFGTKCLAVNFNFPVCTAPPPSFKTISVAIDQLFTFSSCTMNICYASETRLFFLSIIILFIYF